MINRVLFVDDEERVLQGALRLLSDYFDIETASSGDEGLEAIYKRGPFSVIVSDMRMPGMDGATFLRHAYECAPQTPRLLLTGFADVECAINAVNEGRIFRLLSKPCPAEVLRAAIDEAARIHESARSETAMLEETLAGSIAALGDILSIVNPSAFGRAMRIRKLAIEVAKQLGINDLWEIEVAASLSQLGCIAVPESVVISMSEGGKQLSKKDAESFEQHWSVANRLLSKIPHLRSIARLIDLQRTNFDGSSTSGQRIAGDKVPLASRILRAVDDYDLQTMQRVLPEIVLERMASQADIYQPQVVDALHRVILGTATASNLKLKLVDIRPGMTLQQEIVSHDGRILVAKGSLATEAMLLRLRGFANNVGIVEPILVSTGAEKSSNESLNRIDQLEASAVGR